MHVTQAAPPTLCNLQQLSVGGDITNSFPGLGIDDYGSERHPHDNVFTALPGFIAAHAPLAILCLVSPDVPEIDQRVQARITRQEYTAAATAITAIRPAEGYEFFAAKRGRPVPSLSGEYFNFGFINKFHVAIVFLMAVLVWKSNNSETGKKTKKNPA